MNTGLVASAPRPLPSTGRTPTRAATAPDPYADSNAPRWLKFLWRTLSARHVFVLLGVLLLPFVATPFLTYQVAAQSLIFGLIALSLSFLAGYGGMVSLAQMSVAGMAGYAVAVLGVSGTATSLGWAWWVVVPAALLIAVICSTLIGWLSVRTDGIDTIMITLAIGVAFYDLVLQNYT
ncbi:MAG: ABC transporter permease subunit, partial [Rubrivivax sp.]